MAKVTLDLMHDASEIVHYDTAGIPLYIRTGSLDHYPDKRALCHWHEDIEFIRILKGRMNYSINGKKILLNENDCLMVNAKQMHYGYSQNQQNCIFICILIHPGLLTANQLLKQKYFAPILDNSCLEYLHFRPQDALHHEMMAFLDQTMRRKEQAAPGYELEVAGSMLLMWSRLLSLPQMASQAPEARPDSDLTIQKDMVSFIYQNYAEKLTLDDIAAAGNVSRSKCCIIIKLYLQQSPIDFLNHYRLEVSCSLLKTTALRITQVATACGFNHHSYYSKIFMQNYGCTPNDFRKRHRAE